MIDVERTFVVAKPVDVVVNYLKDFANAEQWDPGTKSCIQETPGPVQVGTTWHNVSEIKGHETELSYRLEELSPTHIKFVGENKVATSIDDMTFARSGDRDLHHLSLACRVPRCRENRESVLARGVQRTG